VFRTVRLFAASSFAAALLVSSPANAQGPPRDAFRWSLGAGVISSPRPYDGASNQTRAIPLLEVSYKRFYLQGIRAGYRVIQEDGFGLDLRVRAQFAGYEPSDSPKLTGMEERRETAEIGIASEIGLGGRWSLGLGAFADVLGRHDGYQVSVDLGWSRVWDRGRFGLFPSLGVVWQSAEFIDYYAGVRPEEVRPDRPAFEGHGAVNAEVGVLGFYRVAPRWRITAIAQLQRLANEFEDSPIVDRRWGYFGLLGLTYDF
jgi:outer membrane protein